MYIKKLKELTTRKWRNFMPIGCCLANVHKKIKRTHNGEGLAPPFGLVVV